MLLAAETACPADQFICQQVYDLTDNITLARIIDFAVDTPLAIIGLILLGIASRWLLHRLVDRLIARAEVGVLPDRVTAFGRDGDVADPPPDPTLFTRRVQRAKTMGTLIKSIVTGVVVAVVSTMILSEVGVDVAPLIASAGIIGVAIGFGAQSLVKDFLSGVFMIFEDQYGVGDVVDLGEAIGEVEAVSLRVTRLRDVNGTVWYVRNGEILRVGNQSQNWARTVLDIAVGYTEDLERVQTLLKEIAKELWSDDDFKDVVLEEPEVWGVEAFTPDGVKVRVILKTAPLQQWRVAREMRERVKSRFDQEGIGMLLPQRIMWEDTAAAKQTQP